MHDVKFSCPACGQHLQVAAAWSGRQIDCPSCNKPIWIPPPLKDPEPEAPAPPAKPGTQPASPVKGNRTPPAKAATAPAKAATAPAKAATVGAPAERPTQAPASETAAPEPKRTATSAPPKPAPPAAAPTAEPLQVAVLTPEVKLELVRAVRARIANPSAWLPGVTGGVNVYAAKEENGRTVPVEVASPEATRFSLVGAFLREFHGRNVTPTATGRKRLLDREIVEAIREVLIDRLPDEEREEAPDPLATRNPMSISHPECLAALDVLEELYSQRMQHQQAEKAKRRLGTTRLPDVVKKLEKKARLSPEEVATALFHELVEVRRRLDRLEHKHDAS